VSDSFRDIFLFTDTREENSISSTVVVEGQSVRGLTFFVFYVQDIGIAPDIDEQLQIILAQFFSEEFDITAESF
jgi:hypothetical protein